MLDCVYCKANFSLQGPKKLSLSSKAKLNLPTLIETVKQRLILNDQHLQLKQYCGPVTWKYLKSVPKWHCLWSCFKSSSMAQDFPNMLMFSARQFQEKITFTLQRSGQQMNLLSCVWHLFQRYYWERADFRGTICINLRSKIKTNFWGKLLLAFC